MQNFRGTARNLKNHCSTQTRNLHRVFCLSGATCNRYFKHSYFEIH